MSMIVPKDPEATLDYGCDWEEWLAGDTIQSSDWAVSAGLTNLAEGTSSAITTVWISGGTVGQKYTIKNTIITAGGRTDERSLIISIKNR